jgi:ABC-2 type transport system ATP-binding protein
VAREDNGIRVEALVRDFKSVRAVDGIDLQVEPGEIYGFLGPNGAGKSTTVLVLTTLLPPTSGRALVAGHDVVREGPQVRAAIGAALQEAALDPLLTGRDHLRLQALLQGIPRAERRQRVSELLERVGLAEAADRKVRGYSGGMKRRLDLALALVHVAVRLRDGTAGLAEVVRALDAAGLAVDHLELQQPTLDDVFLAKTGRSLEGAGGGADGRP